MSVIIEMTTATSKKSAINRMQKKCIISKEN
jgi:hypothetical protein